MWQALGHLLPIAVAVAFSSVPITAMILILLSPTRNRSAVPFLIGWVVGIAAVIFLSALGAQALPEPSRREPDKIAASFEMLIGVALIAVSIFSRRRASAPDTAGLPRWLQAVGSFGAVPSSAVALGLNFRPKGLLLGVAAGLALHSASLPPAEAGVVIVVYTAISASTVVVPIVATLLAPKRVEPKLIVARDWLSKNGGLVAAVMLFTIGVVILGDGISRF
jgi:Sap, sulfolipid-1-addressing protein